MSELNNRVGEIRAMREQTHRRFHATPSRHLRTTVPPKKLTSIDRLKRQERVPIASLDFLSLETRVNLFQFAISCAAKDLKYDRVAAVRLKNGKTIAPPSIMRLGRRRVGWIVNRGTEEVSTGSYNTGYGEIGTLQFSTKAATNLYVQKDDCADAEATIWLPPHETKLGLGFDEAIINNSLVAIVLERQVELVPLTQSQEDGNF